MDGFPEAMVNRLSTREQNSSVVPAIPPASLAQHSLPSSPSQPFPEGLFSDRLWSAVNGNPTRTLIALVVFYLAIACFQAATKLLWGDELITLAIARQGSLAAIWRALAAGADPNPPLSHWLVHQSTRALGDSALAIRLPAILCVLLAILYLWAILRRWAAPGYAAIGILAFMATRGFDYAYDARSYAPLMGFSVASLALWLASTDRRGWPRVAALTGMAAALALGLSSNYYGVLAFFPIAIGEATHTFRVRRIEPGVWVAMAAAALPLLAFRRLIRHNLAEFAPHAWNRAHASVIAESYLILVEGVFWPVLVLALFAAWKSWKRPATRDLPHLRVASRSLQPHEIAALAVVLLYPILGYLIAVAGGGMISARCVVPVCFGFGLAAALLASRAFGTNSRAGVMLLAATLLWVSARECACAFVLAQQRSAFLAIRDAIAHRPGDQPILVGDSLIVLPLEHYSADNVRTRIVFPIDFDAIHQIEPDDSGEQNLWAGRNGVFPIRIVPYDGSFLAGPEITVVARPNGWLAQRLAADGYHLYPTGDGLAWQNLGGIFTPLAHEQTRVLTARR